MSSCRRRSRHSRPSPRHRRCLCLPRRRRSRHSRRHRRCRRWCDVVLFALVGATRESSKGGAGQRTIARLHVNLPCNASALLRYHVSIVQRATSTKGPLKNES